MEPEGEDSFQISDFSNDVCCIYHILPSRVFPVISHMMSTIERAYCLYTLLTKTSIDYGSVVTSTMTFVRLLDGFRVNICCPDHSDCGVLQGGHDRVEGGSAREWGMGVRFLNVSEAHLPEAEQESRA
jgi:hypothetical protein